MKNSILSLFVLALFFASCSGSSNDVVPVPKTASAVYNLNTSTLSSHVTIEEIFSTKIFSKISTNIEDTSILNIIKNPSTSGINTDKSITMFMQNVAKYSVVAVGSFLANKSQFEEVVTRYIQVPIVKADQFQYAVKAPMFIAWNDDITLQGVMINTPSNGVYEMGTDWDQQITISESAIVSYLENYFKSSGKELLNSDKHFKEALALGGDIQMYTNYNEMMAPYQMFIGMSKLGDLIKDNYAIGNLNFDNGKVVAKSKFFANEKIQKLLKKHFKNHVNLEPLSKFEGKEVLMGMGMELSFEFFVDLLKETGMDGMVNSMLQREGLSLDEISKAFGENMFAGFTGVSGKDQPIAAFGIEIKDKDIFKKLMNYFHSQGGNVFDSTIAYNDKFLVIATSQSLANSILENKSAELNEYAKKLKNTNGGIFIDIDKTLAAIPENEMKERDIEVLRKVQATFKGAYINTEFEGNDYVSHAQLDLKNTNENSLRAIIKLMDELATYLDDSSNVESLEVNPPAIEN